VGGNDAVGNGVNAFLAASRSRDHDFDSASGFLGVETGFAIVLEAGFPLSMNSMVPIGLVEANPLGLTGSGVIDELVVGALDAGIEVVTIEVVVTVVTAGADAPDVTGGLSSTHPEPVSIVTARNVLVRHILQ
jgi:hypothetical protein